MIRGVFLGLVLMFSQKIIAQGEAKKRPNIIYIFTDQQRASMMSAAGNPWLKTPAMDYIANNGIRFSKAYTTNPVCSPARISMMTGRYPSYFQNANKQGIRENAEAMKVTEVPNAVTNSNLAVLARKAGYELIFGGKEHLPQVLNAKSLGFKILTKDEREGLAEEASAFIRKKSSQPYLMILSFINPHDICYMAIRDFAKTEGEKRLVSQGTLEVATLDSALMIPKGISDSEFFDRYCPPVPVNYMPQIDEPKAINWLLTSKNFRMAARNHYTEKQWRLHRWAYCRLTEQVDKQIQTVLDALKESGEEENTLVLFSSDHGEMDGSHKLEHKSVLYEESVNVPFMAMWKGHISPARIDSVHLISSGLDFLPTVCDYMGVIGKADSRGKSLRPLFEGKKVTWRPTLGVESEIGRMVIDDAGYKYIRYDASGTEEQLLNRNKDPFETRHYTNDPLEADRLLSLRKSFEKEWFPK